MSKSFANTGAGCNDKRLAQDAVQFLTGTTDPVLRTWLPELFSILHTLDTVSSVESTARILPDFMLRHPDVFQYVFVRSTGQTLDFVRNVCSHYQEVKRKRQLTDEEKAIGPQLLELLDDASGGLSEFGKRDDRTDNRPATP
jgi:hypothetical protein